MDKVLVDRDLLERIASDDEGVASSADFEDLKRVLAQPAEAEGVRDYRAEFAEGDIEARTAIDELSDALSAVTAERDRLEGDLRRQGVSLVESMHEKQRLRAEIESLRPDAERWRYIRLQGDDTHWLNLLRVDLDEFGGNINAAVDALIDGEAPAMAAKEA